MQTKQFDIHLTGLAHEPDRPDTLRYSMARDEAVSVVFEAVRIAADPARKAKSVLLTLDGQDEWLRNGEEIGPRPRDRCLDVSDGRVAISAVDLATGREIYEPVAFISDLAADFGITAEEIEAQFPSNADVKRGMQVATARHPLPSRRSGPR